MTKDEIMRVLRAVTNMRPIAIVTGDVFLSPGGVWIEATAGGRIVDGGRKIAIPFSSGIIVIDRDTSVPVFPASW